MRSRFRRHRSRVPLLALAVALGVAVGCSDEPTYPICSGHPEVPAAMVLSVGDTALLVGRSYHLSAFTRGTRGTRCPDRVTFERLDGGITVTRGGRVTTTGVGRARILARGGGVEDTAYVSVVPEGVLAAFDLQSDSPPFPAAGLRLVLLPLDGASIQPVSDAPFPLNSERAPAWSPAGDRLVFQHDFDPRLYTVDLMGAIHRLMFAVPGMRSESWAQYSRDGAWIYFTAELQFVYEIWRVHSDGTGAERVSDRQGRHPSPSPDGTRVAFSLYPSRTSASTIAVLDLATGAVTDLGVSGTLPRWSPTGELIAYAAPTGLGLIRPDGTGGRVIAGVGGAASWSPDGEWLAAGGAGLAVVRVSTGEVLPLRLSFGGRLREPAWKP